MPDAKQFAFESATRNVATRFDEFISWGEPGGSGGFDRIHSPEYNRGDPFFTYGTVLLPHSHGASRSWFVRREFKSRSGKRHFFTRARGDAKPEIKNPLAMVRPGRYLSFAKSYLNVYCEIRSVRSIPKATVEGLIFLEKALRDLNGGDNDPRNIAHQTFQRAALAVQRSHLSPAKRFDIGKALEHLSLLLQAGGRFKGDKVNTVFPGFNLIGSTFSFRSPIKSSPRFGKKRPTEEDCVDSGHLTSEEVAAAGLAYRKAHERYDAGGMPTFVAALTGLTLTTASMRPSELLSLRSDALYQEAGRHRMRIPRPKIGIEQDVPVSKKLGPLAEELSAVASNFSHEARNAFSFYLKQSPDGIGGVETLYVPAHMKPLMKDRYLTKEQAHAIINPSMKSRVNFPQRLVGVLPLTYFVKKPGDVYGTPSKTPMAKIQDVAEACRGQKLQLPPGALRSQYVTQKTAQRLLGRGRRSTAAVQALRALFSSNKAAKCIAYIMRDDLVAHLLSVFKASAFPHWPYTSKDRSVRLDAALAVHFESNSDAHLQDGELQQEQWWLPRLLSIQTLNYWISGNSTSPPRLFSLTDVKLENGDYPRLSVQRSRRYHHTAALLAGASSLFANQLAGRESGWAGESYNYRTPKQIVRNSIETYDPDQASDFIGPLADQAPSPKRVVERKVFLAENVAPKHVTEIGGCPSDWALDPCDFHGNCIRCSKHLWRKGDVERLPRILDMKAEAQRTIRVGKEKLKSNPRMKSIEKQVRQQLETLDRCNEILRIESDSAIEIGTIVTFSPAPSAMSITELWSRLRSLDDN